MDVGRLQHGSKLKSSSPANIYLYAGELAQQHAVNPVANIVGALLDGEVEDEKLTPEEFQLFFLMLIAAGNESTRSVTAHGMRLLMEHPEQLQMLVENPEMIPDACEEMLRYNPAFVTMRRTVMEDTEVAGVQMKEGDKVLLPRLRNPQFAEPVKYMRDYFVNGIKEMQITFDPEVSAA